MQDDVAPAGAMGNDEIETVEACCLVWNLSQPAHARVEVNQLVSLREEIQSCAELIGATIAEDAATHGMLLLEETRGQDATAEDSIVRAGQLLCRWAVKSDPPVGLRIGVHTGRLSSCVLPHSKRMGYFGESLNIARMLAETSSLESCVNLSQDAKERLCVMERLVFSCDAATDSYYLEPWTQVEDDESDDPAARGSIKRQHTLSLSPMITEEAGSEPRMSLDEFRDFLTDHGVDVWKFGKGQAKSIIEFYQSVVIERHSQLQPMPDGTLEQFVELVRIDLRTTGLDGKEYQLRLSSEILRDGRARGRNQKLASKVASTSNVENTVEQCFDQRFGLSPELQKKVLAWDKAGYSYEEERMASRSTPGIMTTYKVHEVVIRVNENEREGLEVVGLPTMQPFSVAANPRRGIPQSNWAWHPVGEVSKDEDALRNLLQIHGVNPNDITAEAFAELCDEVLDAKYATLLVREDNELERSINVLKVWLYADILSSEHILTSRWKSERNVRSTKDQDQPVNLRMLRDQSWESAVSQALHERLGLEPSFQQQHLSLDERSYRLSEEVGYSRTYPGLRTVYCIHEVKVRVLDPSRAGMEVLGLPEGNDFTTTRIKKSKSDGAESPVVLTCWCWKPLAESQPAMLRLSRGLRDKREKSTEETYTKRRLPVPAAPKVSIESTETGNLLQELMVGKHTKWDRALNAAKRIREPNYTCRHFFEDCIAAFPEISLYVVGADSPDTLTSSGRTSDDEYQRTMGAMFAVYWLMRLNSDGAQSFCFGVDNDWNPLSANSNHNGRRQEEIKKRQAFLEQLQWSKLETLLIDAGLLKPDPRAKGQYVHDTDRTLAMLVLTAIHDVMKVQALLPFVKQGTWCGYQTGERICDHDAALGYILEYYPAALPSFSDLPMKQKMSVKFTQSKMEYNMGWLVQAEAPPGALFQKFKTVIESGHANDADIAFYFVHWLTDLAGAEPCPLEGCEKFVLKFPQKVLMSFLGSFSIVKQLSDKEETEVLEDYLVWRWQTNEEALCGPPPSGPGSIARLRIVVMAQGDSPRMLNAYQSLPQRDTEVLNAELSLTGCADQKFSREGTQWSTGGPAILVYYAPALLQKAGSTDPAGALTVLAEVFRQARFLFPLSQDTAGETITVRIDALKELQVPAIHQRSAPGEVWVLQKTSSRDAQVHRVNLMQQPKDGFSWKSSRVLFAHVPSHSSRRVLPLSSVNRTAAGTLTPPSAPSGKAKEI